MRNIFSAIVVLTLSACGGRDAPHRAVLVSFDDYSCPKLSPDTGYTVEASLGPDYTICTLIPQKPGLLSAEIFVGGHWELPDKSRFAGFSDTAAGAVPWFYGVTTDSAYERIAYIPTGLNQQPEVRLVIYGGNLHEVSVQREALLAAVISAGMRPNNSFKPTLSARPDRSKRHELTTVRLQAPA